MTTTQYEIVKRAQHNREIHQKMLTAHGENSTVYDSLCRTCICPDCNPRLYPTNLEALELEDAAMTDINGSPDDLAQHAS